MGSSNKNGVDLGRINTCKIVGAKARHIEVRCREEGCTENCFECIDGDCVAHIGGQFDTMADCMANPLSNSCVTAGMVDSGIYVTNSATEIFYDWYFANHPNDPIGDYYYESDELCSGTTSSTVNNCIDNYGRVDTGVISSTPEDQYTWFTVNDPTASFNDYFFSYVGYPPNPGLCPGTPEPLTGNTSTMYVLFSIDIKENGTSLGVQYTTVNSLVSALNGLGYSTITSSSTIADIVAILAPTIHNLDSHWVPCHCWDSTAECCYGPNGGILVSTDVLQIVEDISGVLTQIGPDFASFNDLVVWANANGCPSVTTSMTYLQLITELSICLCDSQGYFGSCANKIDTGVVGSNSTQYDWLATNGYHAVIVSDYIFDYSGCTIINDSCVSPNGCWYKLTTMIALDAGGTPLYSTNIINDFIAYLVADGITAAATDSWSTINVAVSAGTGSVAAIMTNGAPCVCTGGTTLSDSCDWMVDTGLSGSSIVNCCMYDYQVTNGLTNTCFAGYKAEDTAQPLEPDSCIGPGGFEYWGAHTIRLSNNIPNGSSAYAMQFFGKNASSTGPGAAGQNSIDDVVAWCNANVGPGFLNTMGKVQMIALLDSYWPTTVPDPQSPLRISQQHCRCTQAAAQPCDITVTSTSEPCICEGCGSGPGATWECYEGDGGSPYCEDPLDGSGQYPTEQDCLDALALANLDDCETNGNPSGAGSPSIPRVNAAPGTIFTDQTDALEYYGDPANGISGINSASLFFEVEQDNKCKGLVANPNTSCCEGPNSTLANPTMKLYLTRLGYTNKWDGGIGPGGPTIPNSGTLLTDSCAAKTVITPGTNTSHQAFFEFYYTEQANGLTGTHVHSFKFENTSAGCDQGLWECCRVPGAPIGPPGKFYQNMSMFSFGWYPGGENSCVQVSTGNTGPTYCTSWNNSSPNAPGVVMPPWLPSMATQDNLYVWDDVLIETIANIPAAGVTMTDNLQTYITKIEAYYLSLDPLAVPPHLAWISGGGTCRCTYGPASGSGPGSIGGCCPSNQSALAHNNPIYVTWLNNTGLGWGSMYGMGPGLPSLPEYFTYDQILNDCMIQGVTGVTMSTPISIGGSTNAAGTLNRLINDYLLAGGDPNHPCHNGITLDCTSTQNNPQGLAFCSVGPCQSWDVCMCETSCGNITYDCDPKTCNCYDPFPLIGAYTGPTALTDCNDACCPIRNEESWDCNRDGACYDPGTGAGQFTDANSGGNPGDGLAACQASGGSATCDANNYAGHFTDYNMTMAGLNQFLSTQANGFTGLMPHQYSWTSVSACNSVPQIGPCEPEPFSGCNYMGGLIYTPGVTTTLSWVGAPFQTWDAYLDELINIHGVPGVTVTSTYDDVIGVFGGQGSGQGLLPQWVNPGCTGYSATGVVCAEALTAGFDPCSCSDCGGTDLWECLPKQGCVPHATGQYSSLGACQVASAYINSCDGTALHNQSFGNIALAQIALTTQANGYTNMDITTVSTYVSATWMGNQDDSCLPVANADYCPNILYGTGSPQITFGLFIPVNPTDGSQLAGLQVSYAKWDDFLTDAQAIPIPNIGATTTFIDARNKLETHYGVDSGTILQNWDCCECTEGCDPPEPQGRKDCLVLWLDALDGQTVSLTGPPNLSGITSIEHVMNKAYNGIGLPIDMTAFYTWDTIDNLIVTAPYYDTVTWPWHSFSFNCKEDERCQYLIANPDGPNPPRLQPDTTLETGYGHGWTIFFHRSASATEWINSKSWFMGDDWTVSDDANKQKASGLKPAGQPYCRSNYYGHNHADSTTPSSMYESSPLNEMNNTGYRTLKGGVWYLHWVIAREIQPYGTSKLFEVMWGIGHNIQFKDRMEDLDLDMVLANINTRNRGIDGFNPGQGFFSEIRAYNCAFDKYQLGDELIDFENRYGYGTLNIPNQLPPGCGEAFVSTVVDGVDNTHVAVEDGGVIVPGHTGFTAAFWIKMNDCIEGQQDACLFEKGINLPADNEKVAFRLLLTDDATQAGNLYWDVFGDDPISYLGNYNRCISDVAWLGEESCGALVGKWKHIAVTLSNRSGASPKIYIDGEDHTGPSGSVVTGNVRGDSTYTLNIGDSSRVDYTTKGSYSQFMTWNTELTEDEVQEVYSNGSYFDPLTNNSMGDLENLGSPYAQADKVTFYTDMDSEVIKDLGPNQLPVVKYGGVTLNTTDTDPVDAGQPTDIPGLQMWLKAGTKILADQDPSNDVISRADYMLGDNALRIGDKIALWECYAGTGRYVAQISQTYKPKWEGDGTTLELSKGIYTDATDRLQIYHTRANGDINIDAADGLTKGAFSMMFKVAVEVDPSGESVMGDTVDNRIAINNSTQLRIKFGGGNNKNFTIPAAITTSEAYIFTITRDVDGIYNCYIDGGITSTFDDAILAGSGTLIETNAGTIEHILGIPGVGMQGWFFDFMFWKDTIISDGQRKSMYRVMNEAVRTL